MRPAGFMNRGHHPRFWSPSFQERRMSDNPPDTDLKAPSAKAGWRRIRKWATAGLCGLVVLSLLVSAFRGRQHSREMARKRHCQSILKLVGLSLHSYQSVYGELPPCHLTDASGSPTHSWRTIISPSFFYDLERDYFAQLDLTKPWDDEVNTAVLERYVETIQCPSREQPDSAVTHYIAIVGEGTLWPAPVSGEEYSPEKVSGETAPLNPEGIQPRILIVEWPDSDIQWTEPRDLSVEQFIDWFQTQQGHPSVHPGRAIHYLGSDFKVHELPLDSSVSEVLTLLVGEDGVAPGDRDR